MNFIHRMLTKATFFSVDELNFVQNRLLENDKDAVFGHSRVRVIGHKDPILLSAYQETIGTSTWMNILTLTSRQKFHPPEINYSTLFVALDSSFQLQSGEEQIHLRPGEMCHIADSTKHTYISTKDEKPHQLLRVYIHWHMKDVEPPPYNADRVPIATCPMCDEMIYTKFKTIRCPKKHFVCSRCHLLNQLQKCDVCGLKYK